MTKKDRVVAAVRGELARPVPVGFWYHFPLPRPWGKDLAQAETEFYRRYDPDFLKVMHDIPYELPKGLERVERAADWERFEVLDPEAGNWAAQLDALERIRAEIGDEVFIIDTVFCPFAQMDRILSKNKAVVQHLQEAPQAVHRALEAICESLCGFVRAWVKHGGSGTFYALQGASPDFLSRDIYREELRPYDARVLEAAAQVGEFNILHMHGYGVYIDEVADLPCHVLNWSDRLGGPSLSEARGRSDKCLAGGIDEMAILNRSPAEIAAEAADAFSQTGAHGFILTPGCAVPTETPEANLHALVRAARGQPVC